MLVKTDEGKECMLGQPKSEGKVEGVDVVLGCAMVVWMQA